MADSIETLGSYSTFPFLPDYSMGIEKIVTPAYNIISYPDTITTLVDNVSRKPVTLINRIQLHSMADLNTLLTFFDDHKGRAKKFWYYCRTNDFTLKNDLGINDTQIDVEQNGYEDIHVSTDRLYILLNDGDVIVRRITDAVGDDLNSETTMTITPAIDRIITTSDVDYFGRVYMVRFDIDKLRIRHEANSAGLASIRFLELPKEYPAT